GWRSAHRAAADAVARRDPRTWHPGNRSSRVSRPGYLRHACLDPYQPIEACCWPKTWCRQERTWDREARLEWCASLRPSRRRGWRASPGAWPRRDWTSFGRFPYRECLAGAVGKRGLDLGAGLQRAEDGDAVDGGA